jgi:carbamoyltransferase
MPNPGDCGSSLGAAALGYGKKLIWEDPYLGTEIKNEVQVKSVVKHLIDNSYCGIANGRAEFGPRALGNRSLIADPRRDVKDTVNEIKRRQKFRPFAPAILEEFASEYFQGPMNEYMQFVAQAKHDYKSVTHVDGSARVQIVKPNCKSILRPILEEWYDKTGCPMLLNTSLNIKGQPMVDTWEHALEFEKKYNVKVF